MRTKIRLCVAVALAVVLPAAIALGKPPDGKSNSKSSSSSNSGKSIQLKRAVESNNSFKSNSDAPKQSTGQYQKKSGTPSGKFSGPGQLKRAGGSPGIPKSNSDALKHLQQQGGTIPKNFGKAGDLKLDKDAPKRYQQKYQPKIGTTPKSLGKASDSPQRYRGLDFGKPGDKTERDAAFMKHNFPSQYKNFLKDSKGGFKKELTPHYRVNRDVLEQLNRNNSFVKKHDIDTKQFGNHWTHYNNLWKASNRNWFGNQYPLWNDNWGYRHFSWYPWFGWGGWGQWGFGFVWPAWTVGYYTAPYYGYNYYYAGTAAPVYTTNYQAAAPAPAPPAAGANPTLSGADEANGVTEQDAASAAAFADQGESDFKAGNYHAAAKDWQHSLVDDPRNGAVMMLLAQALFAEGKYEEAAGATQAAMQMLPEDKWGVVVGNYAQLYGNVQDYTDQVRALEEARKKDPKSPALRFVLGFQYGYLNYPKQAVLELDKALTLAPRDLGSRKVREIFAAQWPEAPPLPAAVLEAESAQPGGTPAAQPSVPANPPAPSDAKPGDKIGKPS